MTKAKHILINSFLLFFSVWLASCSNQTNPATANQKEVVTDSVRQLMKAISLDVSTNGPRAWLHFFEDSQEFFMVYNGNIAFQNIDSARSIIENKIARQIHTIRLEWTNIRIDSLNDNLAFVGANWHEDITDSSNTTTWYDGYFTSLVEKNSSGWKLRNIHWSVPK